MNSPNTRDAYAARDAAFLQLPAHFEPSFNYMEHLVEEGQIVDDDDAAPLTQRSTVGEIIEMLNSLAGTNARLVLCPASEQTRMVLKYEVHCIDLSEPVTLIENELFMGWLFVSR